MLFQRGAPPLPRQRELKCKHEKEKKKKRKRKKRKRKKKEKKKKKKRRRKKKEEDLIDAWFGNGNKQKTQQQGPELPTVTLTWHKVHELHHHHNYVPRTHSNAR